MTKGLWVYCPSTLLSPFAHFFSYLQSKTFLNIRAVPSSAGFCSNAVLITTPSSSIHFFSFFGVLPSAPTTTGMNLMLLMFRILLISLFSSWYLSIFLLLFFTNSHVSRYSNINYGTSCLILIHYNNIWFSCLYLWSHSIIISHKIFTSSFSTTHSGACSYYFSLLFRLHFPHNLQ